MRKRRNPTVREIKMAVCDHQQIEQAGLSQQDHAGGAWHTKMTCPTCGHWYIHETPAAQLSPSPDREREPALPRV